MCHLSVAKWCRDLGFAQGTVYRPQMYTRRLTNSLTWLIAARGCFTCVSARWCVHTLVVVVRMGMSACARKLHCILSLWKIVLGGKVREMRGKC